MTPTTYRTRTRPQRLQEPVILTTSQRVINNLKARYPIDQGPSQLIRDIDAIEANRQPVVIREPLFTQNPKHWRKALNDDLRANCKKCHGTGSVWILDSDGDVVPDVCNWCQGGARMGAYPVATRTDYPTADDVTEVSY